MIDAMFSAGKYDLPIQFNTKATKGDLKKGIAALLTPYIKDLEANGASAEVVSGVTNFRRSCSYVLSNYLRGIHSNAFDNFTKGLAYLGIENSSLLSTRLGKEVLFRGRVNQVLTDYGKDEMLHIPLNRRGVVTSQRYSFPGSSAGAGAGTGAGLAAALLSAKWHPQHTTRNLCASGPT